MSERTTASQAQALTRVSMARLRARGAGDRPKTGPVRFPAGADDTADPGG